MSKPADICVELSKTLTLCEFKTGGSLGFWLYDETRGMNLSVRAKSKDAALLEALEYYQERLARVEADLKTLSEKVDNFVRSVSPDDKDL